MHNKQFDICTKSRIRNIHIIRIIPQTAIVKFTTKRTRCCFFIKRYNNTICKYVLFGRCLRAIKR